MDTRQATIICDIDGTLVEHVPPHLLHLNIKNTKLTPGTKEKIADWVSKNYKILLITGRHESLRSVTEEQLYKLGIVYDLLIMGVGGGPRFIINDKKPDGQDSCFAINVERNKGLKDVNVEYVLV